MTDSYSDRRDSQRLHTFAVMASVLIVGALLWHQVTAHRDCLAQGGRYSFRADICFTQAAVVTKP